MPAWSGPAAIHSPVFRVKAWGLGFAVGFKVLGFRFRVLGFRGVGFRVKRVYFEGPGDLVSR